MERGKGRSKEGDKSSRSIFFFLQLILSATVVVTPNRKLSFLPDFSSE